MTCLRSTNTERCNIMKKGFQYFDLLEEGEEVRLQRGEPCCSTNNVERNPEWGLFLGKARHPEVNKFIPISQWLALLFSKFQRIDNQEVPLSKCLEGWRDT